LRYIHRVRRFLPLLVLSLFVSCTSAFHADRLRLVDRAVEDAIEQKKLPGGVLLIERNGHRYVNVYGDRAVIPKREAMTEDTIFDAASLTKVVATAPSIWKLVERGELSLDDRVQKYIPEIAEEGITIRHLLTHSSGLRAGLDLRDGWKGYDEGVRRAAAQKATNRPGAIFRYSDVNYILLGEVVRRVSGESLDRFAKRNVFDPLGMRDTGFLPEGSERIAPNEDGLRGVVHDPTARRMGGVAGHAGMFTTASDLAKFARVILAGGFFPKAMVEPASPPEVAIRRAGGFDIDSVYSRPRGAHFSRDSFGHTGWTGGFIWIDPPSQTFYVFLSNRVHPDGKGSVVALQRELGTLVAEALRGASFAPDAPRVRYVTGGADVANGIDVLAAEDYESIRGLRVGLITNRSAIDKAGNPSVDLLRSATGVTVAAIFAPEHGLRGTVDDKFGDEEFRGIPVFSLYDATRAPTAAELEDVDALVFDIQDIGTRFYTYIATMGMAMEAAAQSKKKFIVLDRVNPIGGTIVEGPLPEGDAIFTAWHSIPVRHGMTVGELAQMFRVEKGIDVDLSVIRVKGWKRAQWQDEAGLPWINTSPNMRSLEAAGLYPGIGLLERALSVGRGTETPFEWLGAPYIDGEALARALSVPGVELSPVRFTPTASIHQGKECGGVRMRITDRDTFRAIDLGVSIASALARMYPEQFPLDEMKHLVRHEATLDAIRRGASLEEMRALWVNEFAERRKKFLLY
jgi:uncharacterized protein YbbC (DUF1343 family)/CubicO group peptidase (beta-lactamase class C family)